MRSGAVYVKCSIPVKNELNTEMWHHFKKLTSYHDEDGVGVLPLLDEYNAAVFDKEGKATILRNTFFAGTHLERYSIR